MAEDNKAGTVDVNTDEGVETGSDAGVDKTIIADLKKPDDALQADKGGKDSGDKGEQQPAWRDLVAGDDKKFRKQLDRYADLGAVGKKLRSLEDRLSSGEYKRGLPEGATPDETAAWRKENGLPDKPEGYVEKLALPDGLVLTDADKPIVAEFAAAAHDSNIDPAAFSKLVSTYYAIQDDQAVKREKEDAIFKQQSKDELGKHWRGADYDRNLTAVSNMLASWPEDLATAILVSRTPDGKKLGDYPVFIRQLATIALELNPVATLLPAGGADPAKTVTDRLAEIRAFRRENAEKYDQDKKMQAEELELLDIQSKLQKRTQAA